MHQQFADALDAAVTRADKASEQQQSELSTRGEAFISSQQLRFEEALAAAAQRAVDESKEEITKRCNEAQETAAEKWKAVLEEQKELAAKHIATALEEERTRSESMFVAEQEHTQTLLEDARKAIEEAREDSQRLVQQAVSETRQQVTRELTSQAQAAALQRRTTAVAMGHLLTALQAQCAALAEQHAIELGAQPVSDNTAAGCGLGNSDHLTVDDVIDHGDDLQLPDLDE
eukprot:comp23883_c0_seq1/m.41928 comp23883_c0_seq1/g.41928  ORF comp23883_c0_seq1/g.41928 comp23883_c0_seq1/m.41928 type:complete len:231 (-) comp23883_c0_seq1:210-902(-)